MIGNNCFVRLKEQGVTKRCRLSWLTNSALVYRPKCGGRGGAVESQPMSKAVTTYLTYAKKVQKRILHAEGNGG
jgi:hypothetical protein